MRLRKLFAVVFLLGLVSFLPARHWVATAHADGLQCISTTTQGVCCCCPDGGPCGCGDEIYHLKCSGSGNND